MVQAVAPPDLHIPSSDHVVDVSIIDTTSFIDGIPVLAFMETQIPKYSTVATLSYGFSIKHSNPQAQSKYDHMIFDLGVRKDFQNGPTGIVKSMKEMGVSITVEKDVAEILRDNGEDLEKVGAIIWSHYHFDHTGDPRTFPVSTDLIVGPGFKAGILPGWPEKADMDVDSSAWEGRTLREIDFDAEGKGLKIGGYKAFDFYGDGSLYLLDSPGHAIGHMCALARVKADPAEFLILGGDIAHHGGEFRPTPYLPLPENIQPNPLVPPFQTNATVCPGSIFEAVHPKHSSTEPFTDVSTTSPVHHDHHAAQVNLDYYKEFDAYDNIFAIIAHDTSLRDVVDFYPKPANEWRKKGWKEQGQWRFLRDYDTGDEQYKPQ